jgi:hypothetical protein
MVRIWSGTDDIVGVGFLVGDRQVLTCAHVVARALGLPDDVPTPKGATVTLDFPLHARHSRHSAAIGTWTAAQIEGGGDIAGLVLNDDPPAGVESATLVTRDDLWERSFRTFGFPPASPGGDWASGILLDTQADGWLQIESEKLTGRRVQAGYSGAPLWVEDEAQGVAGMVVATDRNPSDRVAYAIPASRLVQAWPEVLQSRTIPACPYRGLLPFRLEDSGIFFGRGDVITRLTDAAYQQSLVAVVGPSGSGKSSVVLAGLLAELKRRGEWGIAQFSPGSAPLEALAASLIQAVDWVTSLAEYVRETSALEQQLRRHGRLDKAVEGLLSHIKRGRMLIVADQFEELYTLCRDEHERRVFRDIVLDAVGKSASGRAPTLTVVLTMRADFLNQALLHGGFAKALQEASFFLGPMTGEQLRKVIEEPARARGVVFADGLVDRILDDVGEGSGRLPLLEFALTQLWQRQEHRRLSHDAYQAVGGVKGALTQHAEQVYKGLSASEQQAARRVFVQLVMPGEGTADTRRVAYRTDLRQEDWPVVQSLAAARLVVTDRDEDREQDRVQVAHEVLIEGWDRLRQWVAADRAFLIWRERTRMAARMWETTGYDKGALLRGALLLEAEHWGKERADELDQRVSNYLHQSRAEKARDLSEYTEDIEGNPIPKGAIGEWEQSIAISRELGDHRAEAATLYRLARFYSKLNQPDVLNAAISYADQSISLCRQLGDHQAEAATLKVLAELHARLGHLTRAVDYWVQRWKLSSDLERWVNLGELPVLFGYFSLILLAPLFNWVVVRPFQWLIVKPITVIFNVLVVLVPAAAALLFWYVLPPLAAIQNPGSYWIGLVAAGSAIAVTLKTDGLRMRTLIAYPICATVFVMILGSTVSTVRTFVDIGQRPLITVIAITVITGFLWALPWWSYHTRWPAEIQPYLNTLGKTFRKIKIQESRDETNV